MTLQAEIKEFLYDLLVGDADNAPLVDRECLWSKENRPKSKSKSFIMLDLSPERGLGDDKKDVRDPINQRISGIKECTLSLNAYGEGAKDVLQTLWQKLQTDQVVNRCFIEGIAFLNASAVTDLTDLIDNRWYHERAQVDFTISYVRETADQVYDISGLSIQGSVKNAQNPPPPSPPDLTINFKE